MGGGEEKGSRAVLWLCLCGEEEERKGQADELTDPALNRA